MKAVFHLDLDDEKILRIALTNMENLRKAKPSARIVLLVNGPAVQLFRHDSNEENLNRVAALIQAKVQVFLCQNALNAFSIPNANICSDCAIVPAGVVALIELQQQGYAYIKP